MNTALPFPIHGPTLNFHGHSHALVPLLFFLAVGTLFLGWDYYRDWRLKRDFRHYWAGKKAIKKAKASPTVAGGEPRG